MDRDGFWRLAAAAATTSSGQDCQHQAAPSATLPPFAACVEVLCRASAALPRGLLP
jgi:hypothetical protein